ncbi:MAG: hypothetical protein KME49_27080 [Brasilonema octagenarum HA4186-MV1]|nr:hypothetical protein [Brasilonema octagenarum HA4186-MV1]
MPGRKTDVLDCQWLQQYLLYGLLSGSFRHATCFKSAKPPNAVAPEDQICVLRSYIRQRDNLIKSACVHVQRMQKALDVLRGLRRYDARDVGDCYAGISWSKTSFKLRKHPVLRTARKL